MRTLRKWQVSQDLGDRKVRRLEIEVGTASRQMKLQSKGKSCQAPLRGGRYYSKPRYLGGGRDQKDTQAVFNVVIFLK